MKFKNLMARLFGGSVFKRVSLFMIAALFIATVANAASGNDIKAAAAGEVAVAATNRAHLAVARKAIGGLSDGLDYGKAKTVAHFTFVGKDNLTVVVPGANRGGAAVVLDKAGKVVATMVTRNSVIDAGAHVRSSIYLDGVQAIDMTVDAKDGSVISGWSLKNGEKVAMEPGYYGPGGEKDGDVHADRLTWACFRDCLINVMGIPTWLIGTLGAACSFLCALTMGVVCIACAMGVLVAFEAEIAFCLSWCRARR